LDKRLVATGITTAFAAISFSWDKGDLRRSENAMRIIRAVNAQRPSLLCDMRVHARFEVRNMETIDMLNELLRDNQLHLVSLMDHTPGQGQYTDVDHYVRFMKRWMERIPT
jgi:alpha-D-ribose 1-methylphosphonate 5-triphosphate diphosphatase